MRYRLLLTATTAAALVALLAGCFAASSNDDGDPTSGSAVRATDDATGGAEEDGAIAGAPADCQAALKGFTANGLIRGVEDGAPLTNTELIAQVTELFGDHADPVLSLLTPVSCSVLNSVSGIRGTIWEIFVPGLDHETATAAFEAMNLSQVAQGPGADLYRDTPRSTVKGIEAQIFHSQAMVEVLDATGVIMELNIDKPLSSAVKTAEVADLNGTWCADKSCKETRLIDMPVFIAENPARTYTRQLTLVGGDAGCLLLQFDDGDERLIYCPAGVPTPKEHRNLSGDDEKRDRIWEVAPDAPGVDVFTRK